MRQEAVLGRSGTPPEGPGGPAPPGPAFCEPRRFGPPSASGGGVRPLGPAPGGHAPPPGRPHANDHALCHSGVAREGWRSLSPGPVADEEGTPPRGLGSASMPAPSEPHAPGPPTREHLRG
ncbi:uncharacterized protein LOC107402465 isoform X1 [Peromyscus maniculatus bairdii]|uniref:uncharacterized protein LOC107402465 isoform X1 n=1 Tax=Peromyscus maniculatus bairdii TaxID=230844 RepID=UPI003FD53356